MRRRLLSGKRGSVKWNQPYRMDVMETVPENEKKGSKGEDLTRMIGKRYHFYCFQHSILFILIGFLTATSSEDWALVLEVCETASDSEVTAKEASRAIRREFKYGEPQAQLSAARVCI
jgi:hypothetical protein